MRVLLVSANQEHDPDPVVPLGALLVAQAVRDAGHQVRLVDACFLGEGFADELARACTAFAPEVVGLSLRNVDDVAWPRARSFRPAYEAAMRVLRAHAPQAPVVLGGSAFTLFPGRWLAALGAEAGVIGEGEVAFVELLARGVAGVRGAGIVRGSRPAPMTRAPAWDLVDLARYQAEGGSANLQTKRGCPFACAYCTYPALEGTLARRRDPALVVDEVTQLHERHGIGHVFLVDNVFTAPADHALAVCAALERRRLPVRWSCYASPAGLTPELAAAMARAGCTGVDLGSDAAHPATLAGLCKPFTVADITAASTACRAAGLKVCHSLILGGPGETPETLQATVDTIEATQPTAVVALLGVRLYPGTPLACRLAAAGELEPDRIDLDPVFYVAEAVRDTLEATADRLRRERRHWIVPGLDDGHRTRAALLRRMGARGPLWELVR